MADYVDSEGGLKTSKINSGVLITLRLDRLWNDASRHARDGLFSKWNADLDRVFMELVGDCDDKDITEVDKLTKDFTEAGEVGSQNGFSRISKEDKLIRTKQYATLLKKETYLRKLMNKQGKGTAYDEEEDWE